MHSKILVRWWWTGWTWTLLFSQRRLCKRPLEAGQFEMLSSLLSTRLRLEKLWGHNHQPSMVSPGMWGVLHLGLDGGEPGPSQLRQPAQLRAEEGSLGGRRPPWRASSWWLGAHLHRANWGVVGPTPGVEGVQQVTGAPVALNCFQTGSGSLWAKDTEGRIRPVRFVITKEIPFRSHSSTF